MKIYKIYIYRFRGILSLDWTINSNFVCLIGPGDSTKSTILDAIEFGLSPRWNIQFDDTDFYNADVSDPIQINITVGNIPEFLLKEDKFGLLVRGWSRTEGLHDEPLEGDELVITIQLQIDKSLEPVWRVINDRFPEGRPISAKNREQIGVARLGGFIDHHLSWRRGSVLARLTGKVDELPSILADATRTFRKIFSPQDLQSLQSIASQVDTLAKRLGVAPVQGYYPALDIQRLSIGEGGITLHDGEVPLRRAGLGSRRLLSLAIQSEVSRKGGITLIDEVEHGLEPHRLRCLLNFLRQTADSTEEQDVETEQISGQVIMTTHSPVVLIELNANDLSIVRSQSGLIQIQPVTSDLQAIVRKAPSALLGRKVIVCEGKTELGICRSLDKWWFSQQKNSFAYLGVVPVEGGGSDAPRTSIALANLGYQVAFFGDSDRPLNPDSVTMESQGIKVFLWADNLAMEERIIKDLPWQGVLDLVSLAIDEHTRESVCFSISHFIGEELSAELDSWEDSPSLRKAIGLSAKKFNNGKGWFKRVDLGEKVGEIVTTYLESIPKTDLAIKFGALMEWIDEK